MKIDKTIVVSGEWRCGTSLTMQILKALNIKIHYNPEEEKVFKKYIKNDNRFFYEDTVLSKQGLSRDRVKEFSLSRKAIKIFHDYLPLSLPYKEKILLIGLKRNKTDIIKSTTVFFEQAKKFTNPKYFPVNTSLEDRINHINNSLDWDKAYNSFPHRVILSFETLTSKPLESITKITRFLSDYSYDFDKGDIELASKIVKKRKQYG